MRRLAMMFAALVLAVPLAACGGEKDQTTAPETVEGTTTGGGGATGTTEEGTTEEATTGETTEAEATGGETTGGETTGGQGDAAAGKDVFASAGCVGCHTLADAGATGNVGPNLDDAKPEPRPVAEGHRGRRRHAVVRRPALRAEIQDVAAYVSSVAGS